MASSTKTCFAMSIILIDFKGEGILSGCADDSLVTCVYDRYKEGLFSEDGGKDNA